MNSIGERLRNERLRRGLDLREVSLRTKIRLHLLEAIESDDFEKLPGNFFTRSFVRQYAAALEMDEAAIEAELDELLLARHEPDPVEQLAAANQPKPDMVAHAAAWLAELARPLAAIRWAQRLVSRPVGSAAWLVLAVLACSAMYAWWQKAHRSAEAARVPEPVAVAEAREPATAVPAAPVAAPEPPLVVDVGTSRPTWVKVTSDGKLIFTGTLQPNDRRTFQGSQAMQVFTGNAGALDVRFNGRPMGPVGPEGQGRVVDVTAQGLRVSPPPKPRFVYDPLG